MKKIFLISMTLLLVSCTSVETRKETTLNDQWKKLNNQAVSLFNQGHYAAAIKVAKKALSIAARTFGPNHPDVALSMHNLAMPYQVIGKYAEAESLHKRALVIWEKAHGEDHPDVAYSLSALAQLYESRGNYVEAEPLHKRALAIRKKVLGDNHPSLALSMNNLAELYRYQGKNDEAEQLNKSALEIREKALGRDHPDVAESLNNLSLLYEDQGKYAEAEPLLKRALAIREKALGSEHLNVGQSLNSLANLYSTLSDYTKAEPLYKRSLVIAEKALGPENPRVAAILNNLAKLYCSLGDYAKAEPLLKRSLAIYEKVHGYKHSDVARSLNNLAVLYCSIGGYDKAEPLYKRSLAIWEKALGPEHPNVASSLNNLADLYREIGDYDKAESLCKRSLAIWEKALGPEHPDVVHSLNNLARLYAALDQFNKAYEILKRAQTIDEKLIYQVMGFTSESQKMAFLASRKVDLDAFLSLINRHLFQTPSARVDALNVWLKRKGVALEAQKRLQEALVYSANEEAVQTFQELSRTRAQLSRLTFGPGEEGLDAYKRQIAQLEKQKENLETRLARLSQEFAASQKIAKADCAKVAGALQANTALIEFARIREFDFKATGKQRKWLPDRYLSFVLHAGKGNRVEWIDLGPADRIDQAVALLKKEMASHDVQGEKAAESSRKLYGLVFEPLKKGLGDVKELFISPDGNLNLIPFEVIQGPDGRFLIEDYMFNYLAAGRDVLRFGEIKEKGNKVLLMGDPDFDMGGDDKDSALMRLALRKNKETESIKRSSDMRGFHFSGLPGTREEVRAIHDLYGKGQAELYTGKDALEEVIRSKGAPSVLHLATHGFFLSDLDLQSLVDDSAGRGIKVSMAPRKKGKKVKIENPLLRSGIALAGANNALSSDDPEKSDGIMTAEKILGLRLRGTDMVVLSACETGMGEVKAGEGVYGLRRAFTQAGAKSLIMSMWPVPDKETKELMIEFYTKIKSGEINRCQALRQAAINQMKIVKERYGTANPLFWGAFVFMGEP